MPKSEGTPYSTEWLKKAEEDFTRVKRRLDEGDIEDAAFHLQQALEKAFKGFLLSRGWTLKKIHDLEALLDDAVKQDSSLEQFRSAVQQATGYYLIERYPSIEEGPSKEDVAQLYHDVKPLMAVLCRFS